MLFRKAKNIFSVCPKTGRHFLSNRKYPWLIWLFPIAGLLSLIWFLIRVLPKPSRATYPCQRVAAPLASGFVVWITGLIGSTLAYRKAKRTLHQSRYVVAAVCIAVSIMAVWWSLNVTVEPPAQAAFTPTDPPNSPIGVAKGIHPGRVVWTHDPAATSWDSSTGHWWDDDSTDQNVVDYMVSKTIQELTGEPNDVSAWDALFRHFNRTRGLGDIGYQRGEKIVIKINMNQDNIVAWSRGQGMPSPHVIYSVLEQLINVVGVSGSAITIYDASRYIGDPIFDKVRSNPDPDFQSIRFVTGITRNGRIAAARDSSNPLHTRAGTAYFPQCVTSARYLINMALLRPHSLYGVTLSAKNHFGSVYFPSGGGWTPSPLHNYGGRSRSMDTYNCLVNLNGHRHLSGKTLLYMVDGLYGARNQSENVLKYVSFGDDWCSSIFASQDPVAIDSVGLDFLRYEDGLNPNMVDVTGNPDNYMHEAALADNPPSGTFYDPEGDGTRLASLGVHEHWNNPVDRQYSRNLGTGNGIELVVPSFANVDGPVQNLTDGKRYDYIRHAVSEAGPGDHIVVSQGIYSEDINFKGKDLSVSSIDPNDPAVVATTIISGGNRAVTFSGGESIDCVLAGFTITGANNGIYCSEASPTISNCDITENMGAGIKLYNSSNPTIIGCSITNNAGSGLEMWKQAQGRHVFYNYAAITNCIITENGQDGIAGGIPTVTNCTIALNALCGISSYKPTVSNSIIYYNSVDSDGVQIESDLDAEVTYTDVQGGWSGEGNIDAEPYFAHIGFWDTNGTPEDINDDFWVQADYHLQSQVGRWDHNSQTWVQDVVTSPCIDAGDPDSDCTAELLPNGERINMGAYGGTPQASMSF
ncbi:MAG TPA: right-handed parallel beta-helix repeat-containing protein [Sedimentisphaerales bacterium]|nr:right-handed parallel beta-helix repeat-containing protein [Sedimentisphaerales bacterium]